MAKLVPLVDIVRVGLRLELSIEGSPVVGVVSSIQCDASGNPAAVVMELYDGGFQAVDISRTMVQTVTLH